MAGHTEPFLAMDFYFWETEFSARWDLLRDGLLLGDHFFLFFGLIQLL